MTFLERFGRLLYWLSCGIAVLCLIIGALVLVLGFDGEILKADAVGIMFEWWAVLLGVVPALVFYGIGRAFRYLLSGY